MSVRAGREFLSTPGLTTTPDGALQACCLAILRGACPMPAARTGLSLLELESSRITLAGRWASPARLFKHSTLAALRRVKQLFLSVGVGPVHSATGS